MWIWWAMMVPPSLLSPPPQAYMLTPPDSLPRPELLENKSITIYPLPPPPRFLDTSTPLRFILFAPFKAFFQLTSLLYLLLYIIPPAATHILLQNPPAIPTLLVAHLIARLRRFKLIVDWHNFGFSILQLKLGDHPIVWFSKRYETLLGRRADANFAVTNAMSKVLKDGMGIRAPIHTLYDRPPAHFAPLDARTQKEFLESHSVTAPHSAAIENSRTRLLVSSTSWTADEDFSMLLAALLSYDRYASGANFLRPGSAPAVLAIITGRGPLREGYMATIEKLEFQYVVVESVWLEAEDYPKMIACADLGVSLHTSTSGVDLPMKVVDLFGVGVPVAAFGFMALRELVKDGENGVVFKDGEGLGDALVVSFLPREAGGRDWLTWIQKLFDPNSRELERLKMGAMRETHDRWDENWDKVAAPVFGLEKD